MFERKKNEKVHAFFSETLHSGAKQMTMTYCRLNLNSFVRLMRRPIRFLGRKRKVLQRKEKESP